MSETIECFPSELADLPPKKRKGVMQRWSKLCTYYRLLQQLGYHCHSWGAKRLREEAAEKSGVPVPTVQRWQHRIRLKGIRGLIDGRGGDHKHRLVI